MLAITTPKRTYLRPCSDIDKSLPLPQLDYAAVERRTEQIKHTAAVRTMPCDFSHIRHDVFGLARLSRKLCHAAAGVGSAQTGVQQFNQLGRRQGLEPEDDGKAVVLCFGLGQAAQHDYGELRVERANLPDQLRPRAAGHEMVCHHCAYVLRQDAKCGQCALRRGGQGDPKSCIAQHGFPDTELYGVVVNQQNLAQSIFQSLFAGKCDALACLTQSHRQFLPNSKTNTGRCNYLQTAAAALNESGATSNCSAGLLFDAKELLGFLQNSEQAEFYRGTILRTKWR